MTFARLLLAWLGAAVAASIAASAVSSVFVQNALISIGATMDLKTRLGATLQDLFILQALVPLLAIAFLIAFVVASLSHRSFGGSRVIWFCIAGATSFFTMLAIMTWVFGMMPIAGARSLSGQISMSLCGAIGGWLFIKLAPKHNNTLG